ncbi:MAG TPA: M23 family metallopeptidase [Verrucomicrobiae bacterium]|nr:M23 family metallopeptidase [Verrucomicrobiae bacterium]
MEKERADGRGPGVGMEVNCAGKWIWRTVALIMDALECRLPFRGRWFVVQGGDTPHVNQHMAVRAQWFAIDFMKVGGPGQRALFQGNRTWLEDFFSWCEPVLAPVDGTVESTTDYFPDNPLGTKDPGHPAGNHVVIAVAPDRYVFIAHLQKGSIKVNRGDRVAVGQQLGLCGNSGNSDCPHIHMHAQNTPTVNQGRGQNMIFKGIHVELTGQVFENVDWPLIRGLFVWGREGVGVPQA